jgi:hypothetical protein
MTAGDTTGGQSPKHGGQVVEADGVLVRFMIGTGDRPATVDNVDGCRDGDGPVG